MAKNFKYEYKQHIRNTAPDMDKLWNRIESELDSKENQTNTTEKNKTEKTYIKQTKRGYRGLAAIAAAAVIVVAASRFMKTSDNNVHKDTGTQNSQSAESQNDNFTFDTTDVLSYDSLALESTATAAYCANFIPDGDEYFVEEKVLKQTDCFADVTVSNARLTAKGGEYTLKVNRLVTKDGEEKETEITINSKTPYVLQENREYFIPLRNENGSWYIVFENAPQIEITLDGGAVFQNGWDSLEERSCAVTKEEMSSNDFYFDRMKYCDEQDLQKLIDNWKNT